MRLAKRAADPSALLDAFRDISDGLRGRLSLRDALLRAGRRPGSVVAGLVPDLAAGLPVRRVLEDAARRSDSSELAVALLVLAVAQRSGGDPIPAVSSVGEVLRGRVAGAREARAITTQSRMTVRALLFLTPAFTALIALLDPGGFLASLSAPGVRAGLVAGVALQVAGAWWVSRIMAAPLAARAAGVRRVPGVRAVARIAVGPLDEAAHVGAQVAQAADALALVIEAGMSPARAVAAVADAIPAPVGEALGEAAARVKAGARTADALKRSLERLPGPAPARLVHAIVSSSRLGVPLARTLRGLGAELREAEAARLQEAVRSAAVRVLIPVALCILPAFVLAGVVPLLLAGLHGISL